jgi:N utilization substance protein A
MKSRDNEAQPDRFGHDLGQVGPDSGGQSGDTQGLSPIADDADESVEELADNGQAYEAEAVEGVEDAADHPERPVHTHEDQRPSTNPPARRSK